MVTLIDLLEIQQIKTGSDDLFNLLRGAEIDERIDKDVLFNKILVDLGACVPLFDTTITFKPFYENFFKEKARNISELLDTLDYEYNPIWNKDGIIRTEHSYDIDKDFEHKDETSDERLVSADNASDYQPSSKNVGNSTAKSVKDNTHDGGWETRTEQGNIGVTSTQSLIKEQRDVVQFNVYQWIVDELKKALFLLLY